ncbi:maleylpyruvate isomerase N-terminal domain-containing protein [Streptomyces sp. 12297]|uniref:maleylpyruvate isomerase N-terminal domain-containing protein n=1 Tax=Streptomyces sp. NBC_00239 TaxID=2903640 RepID=UPI002E28D978|nr:maleylpyruvate isomerase N-terminal domain-containing protein [Streptomyces sp. NBC_00239]
MDSRDVDRAVAEMLRVLGPHDTEDWAVPAGPLEWSCRTTAAHVAHDLLAYAGQVAGRPADAYLPFDLVVRPDASPREVLQVVTACAGLLGSALTAAGPEARAWHWGPCDPAGFAAMGVAEVLLHTSDITQGLGVPWLPPAPLCAAVLRRLFPDAPPGDPAQVLLWCTGRGELDGRPRRTAWTWQAAVSD